MQDKNIKRLFIGFAAPIEINLPQNTQARIIDINSRHLTIVFLGNVKAKPIEDFFYNLKNINKELSLNLILNKIIFLPNYRNIRVTALTGLSFNEERLLRIVNFFKKNVIDLNYKIDERNFLIHITVARNPINIEEFKNINVNKIITLNKICLYESIGGLNYKPLYTISLEESIVKEKDNLIIKAENPLELYLNFLYALKENLKIDENHIFNELQKKQKITLNEALNIIKEYINPLKLKIDFTYTNDSILFLKLIN